MLDIHYKAFFIEHAAQWTSTHIFPLPPVGRLVVEFLAFYTEHGTQWAAEQTISSSTAIRELVEVEIFYQGPDLMS